VNVDRGSAVRATAAERWVGWATVVCAVHCVLSPVLVLALPVVALGEVVERAVLLALLPVSLWLLWRGVRRHHRVGPCVPMAAGLACWLIALAGAAHGLAQAVLVASGGAVVYVSLQWSTRMAARCGCSSCDA
jgi:hypothetical protein